MGPRGAHAKGRVVITGASRGIGRSLALAFGGRGHSIVACARTREDLDSLARELRGRHQVDCLPVACDLAVPAGREQLSRACGTAPIAGLVNNAGFGIAGPFAEQERSRALELVRLNVEAVVDLCRLFLERLERGSFIVNVASTAAFQPVPLFAVYSASKAFVLSFSEALAEELSPRGVHVLALCPGVTRTDFQRVADVEIPARSATPEAVAARALAALDAKKRVAVHGAANALLAFGPRLAPRRMVAKVAKKVMEPWLRARRAPAE